MLLRREFSKDGAFRRILSTVEAEGGSGDLPTSYWPIGVLIVMIGSFFAALGDVMVRKAFLRFGENAPLKKLLANPTWVLGMFFTAVLDPLSTLAALVFAPASVITPFAGVHIFWGIVLAKFWLKEEVGILEGVASGLIIVGIVLIVIFAGKQRVYDALSDCIRHAESAPSIVYMVLSAVLILLTGVFSFDFVVNRLKEGKKKGIQRLCLAGCSGLLGGNTNIAAKAVSVAITTSFADPRVWSSAATYVLLFLTLFLALGQLFFLNKGLRKFEAAYIVPTTNSFLITSGTIGSIMVLHEYPAHWPLFFFALFLVVVGILLLSYKKSTVWKIITCSGAGCMRRAPQGRGTTEPISRTSCAFTDNNGAPEAEFVSVDASQASDCSSGVNGQIFTPVAPANDGESADSSTACVESPQRSNTTEVQIKESCSAVPPLSQ